MHTLANHLKMKSIVQKYLSQSLNWGTFDCITFLGETQQALHDIDTTSFYKGKYNSRYSAYKISKTLMPDGDIKSNTFLNSYEEIEVNSLQLHTGDAHITFRRGLPHAMVYFEKKWWSVFAEIGFSSLAVNTNTTFKVWRYTCQK